MSAAYIGAAFTAGQHSAAGIGTIMLLFCINPSLLLLAEAEHRSTFYIPYWNVPLLRAIVPRQVQFARDMAVINDCLDSLIASARAVAESLDEEDLQNRDYTRVRLTDRQTAMRHSRNLATANQQGLLCCVLALLLHLACSCRSTLQVGVRVTE